MSKNETILSHKAVYAIEKTGYYNSWTYELGDGQAASLIALTRNGVRISVADIPADERCAVICLIMAELDDAEWSMQNEGIA